MEQYGAIRFIGKNINAFMQTLLKVNDVIITLLGIDYIQIYKDDLNGILFIKIYNKNNSNG